MTTIVYRDGILAADTLMTAGPRREGFCTKIARNDKGDLAAGAGSATEMTAFLKWFLAGENLDDGYPVEKESESSGVVFRADGRIDVYERGGVLHMNAPFYALGSGGEFAMGALEMGADAVKAVSIAMVWDAATGGEIQTLTHDGALLSKIAK